MRTLLICHHDAPLDHDGLARWLASFSRLVGVLVVREPPSRLRKRVRREIRRVGYLRFLDVLAFRVYHAVGHARADRAWECRALERMRARFPDSPAAPRLVVGSPNGDDARRFIEQQAPDLAIARCKTLLQERVFTIPRLGTYVMHPGICPEYRNAHGCFWALANGEPQKIGMTLLRIDRGVDTGPVFAHFHVNPRPGECHVVTEHRAVLDHLDAIRSTLVKIGAGMAQPLDTSGRRSATWGQPWLSAHLAIKRRQARARGASGLVRAFTPAGEPGPDSPRDEW
jgi:hypothetical protein